MKPTAYGWALVFLSLWLPICGAVTVNNFLIIIFGLTVGLGIVSHRAARRNIDSVGIVRKFPDEIFAETPFTVRYEAETSLTRGGAYALRLLENPPLEGSETGVYFPNVSPEVKNFVYGSYVIAARGEHWVRSGLLESSFPFGLARYAEESCGDRKVLVFPKIVPVDINEELAALTPGDGLERPDRFGTTPYKFREYAPGDPRRRIDWKKSARTGELISRDLSEEVSGDILVRLSSPATEEEISRAASLIVHFGKQGIPVSFEAPGIIVEAGKGPQFVRKLLTMLALWDGAESRVSGPQRSPGTAADPEQSGRRPNEHPGEAHARFG